MSRRLSHEHHPEPHRPAPAPAPPAAAPVAPAHAGAGHSFSQIAVSAPGDAAEQQADSFAAEIMRTDGPAMEHAFLSASGAAGTDTPPDDAPSGRQLGLLSLGGDGLTLQRKETGAASSADRTNVGLSGGGAPLDPATRAFMEPRFGHDFSHVRIHTGSDAAQASDSLAARAFTVGSDIAFRLGEYSPGTSSGKELLAHELTHVVQQRGGRRGVQRKPAPAWQGPIKPGGVNTGSGDVATFEKAARSWLLSVLDRSEQAVAQERTSLGLTGRGATPTDGGVGMKELQKESRVLALSQQYVNETEWQAADRVSPVRSSMATGMDMTDWKARAKAAQSDPAAQEQRKNMGARQQQFGKTHPLLLSSELNYHQLGDATPEEGAKIAHERITQVENAIKKSRAALSGGSLTIWDLPELIPTAKQKLGITHQTPLGRAIESRQLEIETRKVDDAYTLAAFQLGLGVISLATMGAGALVGGLSEGGTLAIGVASTAPAVANDFYSGYKDTGQYNQDKTLANTDLNQKASLKTEQPSVMPLVGDAFGTVLDLWGARGLIKDAHAMKAMHAVADDVEHVASQSTHLLAEHPPKVAEAQMVQMAEKRADALIADGKIKPNMKGKFVEAVKKVSRPHFAKAGALHPEGAHATGHPTGGVHPEGAGRAAAETHPMAGHPSIHPEGMRTAHPASASSAASHPHPAPTIIRPSTGPAGPSYPTAHPVPHHAPKPVVHAETVPVHAEPVTAPAESAVPAAPEPQTKTLENGTQVSAGESPKTIVYSDGTNYVEGQGWHDAQGKRIYPKTVHGDSAGNQIAKEAAQESHGLAPTEPTHAETPAAPTRPTTTESAPSGAEAPAKPFSVKGRAGWEAMREQAGQGAGKPTPTRRGLRGTNDDGKVLYSSEEGHTGPVPEAPKPVEAAETNAAGKTNTTTEIGGKKDGPYRDPSAEFAHGETAHAPMKPVELADLTQIDQTRAKLNALKEQKEYHVHYDDTWSGTKSQVGEASRSAAALDGEINRAEAALKQLETKANLPEAVEMKARLANTTEDPIALINQNQSWSRLGELNLGKPANQRLLAARDAIVMRLKTEIEQEFHVFIHAGDGSRVIDKVTAGKVTTDIDLVVTPRAPGDEVSQAKLGQGSLDSRPAEARAELQRRLNAAFSGDSNQVAMVNVFMGDKRLPFVSAEGAALKAAQDTEGMVEGLRSLKEVNPELYEAQKRALLQGAEKDSPVQELVTAAEGAEKTRVDNINKALAEDGVEPNRATPTQKTAAQERVRQQKEKETQNALHAYEAKRGGMTDEQLGQTSPEFRKELDQLAVAHNKAVQELAIYTPEAYTPHGALEVPLSKREIAIGTIEDDLSKPMVANKDGQMVPDRKDLTLPVAAQAALGETRMFLDVLHHTATPVNQAAHCAKYVGRFMNQFLQVIELEKYPLISRLRSTPEAFHLEMVAVKDIGDENAKIRRLMELLGEDNRNPTAVVQQFINESEQMMVELNTRLVKGTLNGTDGITGAGRAAGATGNVPAPSSPAIAP